MWLDAVAIAILAVFTTLGVVRGALVSGMSVLALVAAYAAAVVGATRCGDAAAERLELPEFLGAPLVGMAFFLAVYLAMGVVSSLLKRRERRLRRGPRSARDRFLGACFGGLRGAFVMLLLGLLAIWLDALRTTGTAAIVPPVGASRAAAVTGSLVEAGVEAALGDADPGARFAARMAARPGASIADLQAVLDNPRIAALQADRLFWTYVETGAVDAALNRGSFIDIAKDEELRGQLAALGLVEAEAGRDPLAFRTTVDAVLREVGPRVRDLRDDPELQRLIADPEVVQLLRSGDTAALLGHPGFRDLVARVASR